MTQNKSGLIAGYNSVSTKMDCLIFSYRLIRKSVIEIKINSFFFVVFSMVSRCLGINFVLKAEVTEKKVSGVFLVDNIVETI